MTKFTYFKQNDIQDYSYVKVPQIIIRGSKYSQISSDAKCLYIAMLERQSLSNKNGWADERGNVYIIFSQKDAAQVLNCSRSKLTKVFAELDVESGVGLIKRKRQGLCKPDIIYLNSTIESRHKDDQLPLSQKDKNANNVHINSQPETQITDNRSFNKKASGCINLTQPDASNESTNNINNNKIKINKIKFNNPSFNLNPCSWMEERNEYTEIIKQNIDYDSFIQTCRKSITDEIINTMVNAICSQNEFLFIGGEYIPKQEVKKRFLTMNQFHLEYVYHSLMKNKSSVRNINAFLLTCLYRAYDSTQIYKQLNANKTYSENNMT